MIFDSDKTTKLIRKWKIQRTIELLSDVLLECETLVEVIASKFDNIYRDDLIQESYIRIQYSLQFFDADKGNLHKYLTSVITNACLSYIGKENRHFQYEEHEIVIGDEAINDDDIEQALSDLIIRNRIRFPSVPTDMIDDMSEFIFISILDGIGGKSRGAIRQLTHNFDVLRSIATTVYHSSLIYLRTKYFIVHGNVTQDPNEFSLTSDIRDIIGNKSFDAISILFSGMYIKFP